MKNQYSKSFFIQIERSVHFINFFKTHMFLKLSGGKPICNSWISHFAVLAFLDTVFCYPYNWFQSFLFYFFRIRLFHLVFKTHFYFQNIYFWKTCSCTRFARYPNCSQIVWEKHNCVCTPRVCNQSSHYAKTLKVNTTLQAVFLGTHLNGRRAAISLPIMLKP